MPYTLQFCIEYFRKSPSIIMMTSTFSKTIQQNLKWACALLGYPEARLDTEILLAWVLQKDRSYLFAHGDEILNATHQSEFEQLIEQRKQGHPVAYLTGRRDFWTLSLAVNPSTLIPRPETEHLVEKALELGEKAQAWRVLDLGTGTGAIALALAKEKPDWQITATDFSQDALHLARLNAQRNHIEHVEFIQSDWFSAIHNQFDLIISNPPYIAEDDPHLNQGDVRYEPNSALTAGADGLDDIRLITEQAKDYLQPNGWLMFEHGFDQGAICRELLQQQAYKQVTTEQDLAGLERLTMAQTYAI